MLVNFDLLMLLGGSIFNTGFLIYDIWFTYKIQKLEKRQNFLFETIIDSAKFEGDHYDSLCKHIQTNREIELDVYEEVKRK